MLKTSRQTSNKHLTRFKVSQLAYITFHQYTTLTGETLGCPISYLVSPWGLPVVLVNHSLTGMLMRLVKMAGGPNSLVMAKLSIPSNTPLCFNFPENGVDNDVIEHYDHLVLRDVANLFKEALDHLGVDRLYAAIGGSIGGALIWEMELAFQTSSKT